MSEFRRSKLGWYMIVVAGCGLLWCPLSIYAAGGPSDAEPNDTQATAVDTGLADDGSVTVFGGIIGNSGDPYADYDVDFYSFEIPDEATMPKLLTVSAVSYAPLDAELSVFAGSDEQLAYNDDEAYPEPDPLLRTYVLTPGVHYVRVAACANGSEGTYDLTITVESTAAPASPYEPNDTPATATDLGTVGDGQSVEVLGEFIGDGPYGYSDRDMYSITTTGPAIVRADVLVEHLDSTLEPCFDYWQSAHHADVDSLDLHREVAVFAAGEHVVTVAGMGNGVTEFRGSVGYYDLKISVAAIPVTGGPYESNDSILEAPDVGLFGYGQVTLSAYLGDGQFAATRGDVDFYAIYADDGDWLTIDVDAAANGSGLDSVVVVFDYLGRVVGANDNDGVTTDSLLAVEAYYPLEELPATLYAMVLGVGQQRPPDPLTPAATRVAEAAGSVGAYDVTFTLGSTPPAPLRRTVVTRPVAPLKPSLLGRTFAAVLDYPADAIVELAPRDGSVVNSVPVPGGWVTPSSGLAVHDETLLYLRPERFPKLAGLDPETGEVLWDVITWFGSGYYGDVTVIGNRLYVTDLLEHSIHELDATAQHALRTLPVRATSGVTLSGGLASLMYPPRLYAADAFNSGTIHRIDPQTGQVDDAGAAVVPCSCDADFDADGDVDADDQAFFDECNAYDHSLRFGCQATDLDCDGDYDNDDAAILDCQENGPGNPPTEGCCPDELPEVPIRATALGGTGVLTLLVNDWNRDSVDVYRADAEGPTLLGSRPAETAFGAIGSSPIFWPAPGLFGPTVLRFDRSDDWAVFQKALTHGF